MRDVARASGCSATTVSIVLNNAPLARYIPASTKDRIEKAAKKLGYRPKVVAHYLRSKRNRTVGVMVFDLTDPFCTLILRGIENALYQAAYIPLLTDAHNQRPRFERCLELLLDHKIEGLIVVANWLSVDINLLSVVLETNTGISLSNRHWEHKRKSATFQENTINTYTLGTENP